MSDTLGARQWTAAEEEFLRANSPALSYAEIGLALGRGLISVKKKSLAIGLRHRDAARAFTPEEDSYLLENFESLPIGQVAAHLGRNPGSIKHRTRPLGLMNQAARQRQKVLAALRPDYFSQIDTPVKAYVLGLMASDGNVATTKNGIGIKLHPKDTELVALVRDELSPATPLRSYTQAPLPGYTAQRPYVTFKIGCAQMKTDLAVLGITPRKSSTIQYPELPPHLENSFILGCFDGDGTLLSARGPSYWKWELYSASESFLVATREAVHRHTGLELRKGIKKEGLYLLNLSGGRSIQVLDAWLHADMPGLARKRLKEGAYARAQEEVALRRKAAGRKRSLSVYPLEKREHVRKLRAQGLSCRRIADETGVNIAAVKRLVKHPEPDGEVA